MKQIVAGLHALVFTALLTLPASMALAQSSNPGAPVANPCAPKVANPCAPKAANPDAPAVANPCAPKVANPCAPKAANPCAAKPEEKKP